MRLMSVCYGKRKSNRRLGGWFLPIPVLFFHSQRNSRENQAVHNSSMRQLNARNKYGSD